METSCSRRIALSRFPAVWVPDPEVRDLRALIGHRMRLMKMRKGIRLGLHAVALNARLPGRSARLTIGRIRQLKGLVLGPHTGRWRDDGLQLAELLGNKIRMLDGVIADAAKGDRAACRLMTHPGVGPLTALITVLTLGPVRRFGGAKAVVSYAGLAPSVKASADRYRMGPISKRGNVLLGFALVQAAVSSVKYEPALRQVYLALSRRRGHAKAKIGAARRLLIRLYIMLRDEIDYQEFTRRGHHHGTEHPRAVIR